MPGEKRVVVPGNMIVVPLHDAGTVQNGLGFEEASARRGRGGVDGALTLMTTASTIGPRVSPMFTESMAVWLGYSYGYTERTTWVVEGDGRGTMGRGERLGKGGLIVRRGRLISVIQESETLSTTLS